MAKHHLFPQSTTRCFMTVNKEGSCYCDRTYSGKMTLSPYLNGLFKIVGRQSNDRRWTGHQRRGELQSKSWTPVEQLFQHLKTSDLCWNCFEDISIWTANKGMRKEMRLLLVSKTRWDLWLDAKPLPTPSQFQLPERINHFTTTTCTDGNSTTVDLIIWFQTGCYYRTLITFMWCCFAEIMARLASENADLQIRHAVMEESGSLQTFAYWEFDFRPDLLILRSEVLLKIIKS